MLLFGKSYRVYAGLCCDGYSTSVLNPKGVFLCAVLTECPVKAWVSLKRNYMFKCNYSILCCSIFLLKNENSKCVLFLYMNNNECSYNKINNVPYMCLGPMV